MKRILAVLVMVAVASTCYAVEKNRSSVSIQQKDPINGRYVFMQLSDMRRDQYMLDTQTGRLWNIVNQNLSTKSNEPIEITVLSPVMYSDFGGTTFNELPVPIKNQ